MAHLPFRNFVHLTQSEAYELMRNMLSGGMSTEGIAEVLSFLRRKGETIAELVGFASAIRDMSPPVELDQSHEPVLDTCGTGGDATNSFNVSTATAFVVAGAGLRVAKHGNRRISSQCGSADVLEALGCFRKPLGGARNRVHPSNRHRFSLRSVASSGSEARARGASVAERPDSFQPAWPAHQSSACACTVDWRVFGARSGNVGARFRTPGHRASVCCARFRWA